ncbi:relaxase MobL, partial [Streptomyces koyangensis]
KETYMQKDKLEQAKLLKEIHQDLPTNKKYWQYGSKFISDNTRQKIDQLTDSIMKENPNYKEYFQRTKEESDFRKSLFGDSERSEKDYAINKKKDIQKRLGNALLTEMKKNTESLNRARKSYIDGKDNTKYTQQDNTKSKDDFHKKQHKPFFSSKDIYRIKRAINDDFEKYKAEKDYEQMQQRIEWERQKNRM